MAIGISIETNWQLSLMNPLTHGHHFMSTAVYGMLGEKSETSKLKKQISEIKIENNSLFFSDGFQTDY